MTGRAGAGRSACTGAGGSRSHDTYSHVVIATGRYHWPVVPAIAGLEGFSGTGGVIHTSCYKHPDRYRGLRILVAGCAISALEIASDLAMLGAERVVTTNRRQRYVLPKLISGAPIDHVAFSRCAGMAAEFFPEDAVAAALQTFVHRVAGNPGQFGAPRAAESIADAGIALCQHYLPLVAEGRIEVQPWIESIDGQAVTFANGRVERFDAIVFGTGYELDLCFLDDEIRCT